MKFLVSVSVFLMTGFLMSETAFAVDYQCADIGLEKVAEHLEYSSTEEFLKENSEIFSCKSKTQPYREILQWGDGSGLVGIEFEIQNGACFVVEEPYTGQDDQDLDVEWFESYCQP